MKRKIAFHPKFISVFIILILVGVIVTPGFNSLDIARSIDNISLDKKNKYFDKLVNSITSDSYEFKNIGKLNNSNYLKNIYPPVLCVYMGIFFTTYGLIAIFVIHLYLEGEISEELMLKIVDYLENRMERLYNIGEFLNCPGYPWNNPKNKLDEISNHKLNYKYNIIESSLKNINFSLSNCSCQNLNKSYFSFNNLILCSLLFIQYKLVIMKLTILRPIVEKLDIKVLTIIYNLLVIQRFYRVFNLAEQLDCDWLDNID